MNFKKIFMLVSFLLGGFITYSYMMEQPIKTRVFNDPSVFEDLANAIRSKDIKKATNMLKDRWIPNVNQYKDGHTPLHDAVIAGDLGLVKILVEKCGADITSKTQRTGLTPLDSAISYDFTDIANYLKSKGAIETNPEERFRSEIRPILDDQKKGIINKVNDIIPIVRSYFKDYPGLKKAFEKVDFSLEHKNENLLFTIVAKKNDDWILLVNVLVGEVGFKANILGTPRPKDNLVDIASPEIKEYLQKKGGLTSEEQKKQLMKKGKKNR